MSLSLNSFLLTLALCSGGDALVPSSLSSDFESPTTVGWPKDEWQQAIDRDARVSFTRRSGHDASDALVKGLPTSLEIAAALIAIGSTRPRLVRDQPLLESYLKSTSEVEQRAALLALGEFGEGAEAVLLEHLVHADPTLRACAMLALLRSGRRGARDRVEAIAASGGDDGRLAGQFLVFTVDPHGSRESDVLRFLLDLRWDAARKYGLVDNESWSTRQLELLIADPEFLDAVVLGSVATFTEYGVKDHLLASLLAKGKESPEALRAATIAMPDELAAMIEADLWKPRGLRSWRMILDHIDERRVENKSLNLLGLALEIPELEVHALMLLARAGLPEPLVGLEDEWADLDSSERRLVCEAWAIAEQTELIGFLRTVQEDADPEVRAWVLTCLARLGDIDAHARFREILIDPAHADYVATLAAAFEQSEAPLVRGYLEELLPKLQGEPHLRCGRALAFAGVAAGRQALAKAVSDGFPSGEEGVRCVRALMGRDPAAHMDLYRRFFPVEDDLVLNVELARAIVASKDDLALRFLRPALWSKSFDRSVLAALIFVRMHGMYGLRDEVKRPPLGTSTRDLRRAGFALGEWGGIGEVATLRDEEGLLPNSPVLQGALLGALGRRTH